MYSSIALVDAGYLLRRNYQAKASDPKLTPQQVSEYTIGNVISELDATRAAVEHVVLCCDAAPYWRTAEYPEYKAGRPEPDPEYAVIKRAIFERVKVDGYTIARVETFEADDLVATLAKTYAAQGCPDVRIVGADKDAMQCVTDRVRVFVPKVGKRAEEILGPAEVKKKFGVLPESMALYQALVGDKGDNIPGVEKVGQKTATDWINTYGNSLMKLGIQLGVEIDKGGTLAKTWANFGEAYPRMKFWLRMTTLRTDVPIDSEALLVKQKSQPLVPVDDAAEPDPDLDDIDAQFAADFGAPSPEDLAEEAAVMAANDDNGQRLAAELAKPPVETLISGPPKRASCDKHADCAEHDRAWEEYQQKSGQALTPLDHPRTQNVDWASKAERLERNVAKANVTPANGKTPTESEIEKVRQHIAEHNAKEAKRAAKRATLPDPKAVEAMGEVAKEFAAGEAARKTNGAGASPADKTVATAAPAPADKPKVTEAEFTEQPKQPGPVPKGNDGTAQPKSKDPADRLASGEFDTKATTTALARVPMGEVEFRMSLQPRTLGESVLLAKILTNSRRFPQFGSHNEGGVLSIIMTGRELGLSTMQALNGIHDINGKPFTGWQIIKYLAEKHPDCEWLMCSHADDKSATWRTKHRIHGILEYTYTVERARKAGLFQQNGKNWDGKTEEMLTKTALSKGCWRWYTSALVGLPLQDDHDAPEDTANAAQSI